MDSFVYNNRPVALNSGNNALDHRLLALNMQISWMISRLFMNICLKYLQQINNVANFEATNI